MASRVINPQVTSGNYGYGMLWHHQIDMDYHIIIHYYFKYSCGGYPFCLGVFLF